MRVSHSEALKQIRRERLVAILRGVPMERLDGVVQALIDGGIRVLEFPFDHTEKDDIRRNAEKIEYTVQHYGDRLLIGCGTALTVEEVDVAHAAGCCLVVTPCVDAAVIRRTRELGMVSMPGAMTSTEVVSAYQAGADIVKLFPAGDLGAGYLKSLRGPLGFIPMFAVGGIKPEDVGAFLRAGACGFGIGSQMVPSAAVQRGDYDAIREHARQYKSAIERYDESRD